MSGQRMLDRLLAKCDEFTERELAREADDEVLAVIDDLRLEMLAVMDRGRLWST